jgi:hypothetical protein
MSTLEQTNYKHYNDCGPIDIGSKLFLNKKKIEHFLPISDKLFRFRSDSCVGYLDIHESNSAEYYFEDYNDDDDMPFVTIYPFVYCE